MASHLGFQLSVYASAPTPAASTSAAPPPGHKRPAACVECAAGPAPSVAAHHRQHASAAAAKLAPSPPTLLPPSSHSHMAGDPVANYMFTADKAKCKRKHTLTWPAHNIFHSRLLQLFWHGLGLLQPLDALLYSLLITSALYPPANLTVCPSVSLLCRCLPISLTNPYLFLFFSLVFFLFYSFHFVLLSLFLLLFLIFLFPLTLLLSARPLPFVLFA